MKTQLNILFLASFRNYDIQLYVFLVVTNTNSPASTRWMNSAGKKHSFGHMCRHSFSHMCRHSFGHICRHSAQLAVLLYQTWRSFFLWSLWVVYNHGNHSGIGLVSMWICKTLNPCMDSEVSTWCVVCLTTVWHWGIFFVTSIFEELTDIHHYIECAFTGEYLWVSMKFLYRFH